MPVYEVTQHDFSAASSATDQRVLWVWAVHRAEVVKALKGTLAKVWPDALPSYCDVDIDFELPTDRAKLRKACK